MAIPVRRRAADILAFAFATLATAFGLAWLAWILWTTLLEGAKALTPALFTQMTPPPGSSGGLLNAFYGSAVMILLGVARIAGETAPLLFTALNNQFWSGSLNAPLANVPVVIFQYAMSPYDEWHELAWAGAFVLTAFVLILNLLVRFLARRGARK